jgi:outer membrane protein assembly factor BamB
LASEPARRIFARGAVQASVVFGGSNEAYAADMAGWVQAFGRDGKTLWQRHLEGGVSASPAVDVKGGRVFIGTHAGWVYALPAAGGAPLWSRRLPSKRDPRILSDLLFVPERNSIVLSSWGGQFCELDAASGEPKGAWDAGLSPQAGAAADAAGNVYCLRAVRGEGVALVCVSVEGRERVLHRQSEPGRGANRVAVAAAPVVDETRGRVIFTVNGDRDCQVRAWSLREERLSWVQPLPGAVVATPAVDAAGNVLVADLQGSLRGLRPDGSTAFQYESGAEYLLAGPVCSVGGQAFLGDPLGRLHLVDAAGVGRPVFEADRALQARPSFDSRGNLHVASVGRGIYVFRNLAAS